MRVLNPSTVGASYHTQGSTHKLPPHPRLLQGLIASRDHVIEQLRGSQSANPDVSWISIDENPNVTLIRLEC
jgi:hypothetical protein